MEWKLWTRYKVIDKTQPEWPMYYYIEGSGEVGWWEDERTKWGYDGAEMRLTPPESYGEVPQEYEYRECGAPYWGTEEPELCAW